MVRETHAKAMMGVTSGGHQDDRRVSGGGRSPSCAAGVHSSTGAMGSRVGAPPNTEHRAALRPGDPASGTSPEEIQNAQSKGSCAPRSLQRYLHSRTQREPGVLRGCVATGDAVHPHSGTFASHEEQGRATIVTARRDLEDTGQGQKPDAGQMLQEATETSQDDRLREADEDWGRESLGAGAWPRDARHLTPGAVRPAPTRVARCQLNVRSEGRPHARGLYHESLRQAGGKEKSAGQRWRLAAGPRAVCRGHHRTGTGGQEPTVPLRGSSAPSAFGTFGT